MATTDQPSRERRQLRRLGWSVLALGTLLVLVGVVQIKAYNDQQDAAEELDQAQGTIAAIQQCNVKFAVRLAETLRERDAVGDTERDARTLLWQDFRRFISQATPATQEDALAVIDAYLGATRKLEDVSVENPYPRLKPCLEDLPDDTEQAADVALRLVADVTPLAGPGHPGKWDDNCLHRKVTIRGTDAGETITGTTGRDVIFAYSGNDHVVAGDGRDRICGRFGGDVLNGGDGFDRINGGNGGGFDLCFGERQKKCP